MVSLDNLIKESVNLPDGDASAVSERAETNHRLFVMHHSRQITTATLLFSMYEVYRSRCHLWAPIF